ncbi:MAG: heme exporter protein CcmD [Dehalococcoidales bacterium]|jgi:CcmD family protein|nr:heme exporter protein CcmD [Dehalococcoidales bacterium]MDP7286158.1 heme exporter protein CcmD [Dehalococcoidales bacterium]MDP7416215.1 heme exporter protein CcmD [Dehalococcoidales bacterium]
MENVSYVFVAFAIVWAVVFGYILLLLNRQRRLQQEIDLLKQRLEDRKSGD